jgi:tetratricopeptide (TPR) repeat protein
MTFRLVFFCLVASLILSNCNSSSTSANKQWNTVYQNSLINNDYMTAVVALNHLIIEDTANIEAYYDSLSFFYIKKLRNFSAGEKIVEKGLQINPNKAQLLEFKSVFLSAQGKINESREHLLKAHKISGLNKHLYMYATTYASEGNIDEYSKVANSILYNPATKPELVEVNVDENNTQLVDIKSLCYLDKAKTTLNKSAVIPFLDSALAINPDYQEAMYYKNKLTGKE